MKLELNEKIHSTWHHPLFQQNSNKTINKTIKQQKYYKENKMMTGRCMTDRYGI